jgi:class 3 adenylate cyclase
MSAERRERKIVTVLFADLVGFTARAESLDPEDVAALLRGYHERLRSELERWGGTVEKFIGDAVMAVFGAPLAREDDPERAVRAALAIREWAAHESEVEVRIAVNSGEALVTLDARPEAGEGMVAGDVVNTAARMQSAAPANGILVGEQTYRATEHVIDYRAAPPVDAKGKGEPVRAWEAVEARSRFGVDVRQHGGAPLVGRTRELDVLTSALERVQQQERSPQLVTLVGVPGIGKSRLVWELFQAIDRGDELVFWRQGRSLPYGEGVSFWALAEMVKAQAGILEGDQRERVDEKLSATVVELVGETDAEWVASQLRALVGSGEPAGEREEAFIEEAEEAPHYLENANRRVRAMIRFARGDTEGALADAHRAAELGRRARDPQAVFPSLSVLAELLLEEGRVDEARAAAEELATRAKAGERPGFPPRGSTVFALVTLIGAQRVLELVADGPATSSKDAAIAIVDGELVVAADIYSLHGDVVSEAATRMRAAEKLLAEGNRRDADAQLQKALAFYRSVGATRYVREGEALLAASA